MNINTDSSSKVVLITGAAKRVGNQIAQFFAKKGHGVAIHYSQSRSEAEKTRQTIAQLGGKATLFQADLSKTDEIIRLIHKVYNTFGQIDYLINNAAVFWQDHFDTFSFEQLDQAWAINARAPILLTRTFYEQAKQRQQTGVVINVIDQKVQNNFHRDHFSYTVAKATLGNLTQMLAISAAPILRVNAVYPGLMLPSDNQTAADFTIASQHATPLKYIANPDDLAQAIYLLTQATFNATDFVIDAGQNLIKVQEDVLYTFKASTS